MQSMTTLVQHLQFTVRMFLNRNNLAYIIAFLFAAVAQARGPGLIMAAGGDAEGELGETDAWSYKLYKRLIENGDVTGDGKIKIVVISTEKPRTNFMIDYLKSMGGDSSENLIIGSREDAENPALVDTLADADVVFLRGGDQADAYRNWKGTRLHELLNRVRDRGGAIGGTSSGAMSLAGYALAGGQHLDSLAVLKDSHSPRLEDESGSGSSIHSDFLNLVPNAIIDTHVGGRERLGRMLGVHAKAVEDSGNRSLLMIGLEEKTGIVIQGSKAQVYGTGVVHFIQQTPETQTLRRPGHPLIYTDIRDDALTDGWTYDMNQRKPDTDNLPPSARAIQYSGDCGSISGKPRVRGNHESDKLKFARFVDFEKRPFEIKEGQSQDRIDRAIGLLDVQSDDRVGSQDGALKALYEHPGDSAFMIPAESQVTVKTGSTDEVVFSRASDSDQSEASTMVLDCKHCSFKSVSPFASLLDEDNGDMRSVGLVNLRVHALAESDSNGWSYNIRTHEAKKSLPNSNCPDCSLPEKTAQTLDQEPVADLQKHMSCQ